MNQSERRRCARCGVAFRERELVAECEAVEPVASFVLHADCLRAMLEGHAGGAPAELVEAVEAFFAAMPDVEVRASAVDEEANLGPCCGCDRRGPDVRNVVMLPYRVPAGGEGRGWGCLQCGLPSDGATAVFCDACLDGCPPDRLFTVCVGYPKDGVRADLADGDLELFEHRMALHPEAPR